MERTINANRRQYSNIHKRPKSKYSLKKDIVTNNTFIVKTGISIAAVVSALILSSSDNNFSNTICSYIKNVITQNTSIDDIKTKAVQVSSSFSELKENVFPKTEEKEIKEENTETYSNKNSNIRIDEDIIDNINSKEDIYGNQKK